MISKKTPTVDLPIAQIPIYSIIYNFTFVSLVAPYLVTNLRLSDVTSTPSTPKKSTALMKQSYLIYTWFYFLTLSVKKTQNKAIKFAFLPVRRKFYTLTKAPMAHKTNSKEQFIFRYYKFKASIATRYEDKSAGITTLTGSRLSLLLIKTAFPIFGTNLLMLKYSNIVIGVSAGEFMNYANFLRRTRKRL